MIAPQLIQSQPNDLLIDRAIELLTKFPRDLCGGIPAIATLPNEGGGLIETVRAIVIEIVNQYLVRQFLNHETVFASKWLPLPIFIFHVCLR